MKKRSIRQRGKARSVQQSFVCGEKSKSVKTSRCGEQSIGRIHVGNGDVARSENHFVSQRRFIQAQHRIHLQEPLVKGEVDAQTAALNEQKRFP